MKNTSNTIHFLYSTVLGRCFLKIIMELHLDRIVTRFLCSHWSRLIIKWYIKHNQLTITQEEIDSYHSFRDFFIRTKNTINIDTIPEHLISPCDGWLSAFPINSHSCFSIKNSIYQLKDFLQEESLAQNYYNGTCLIFRLCASDYHHYCYIDDGFQGQNHYISGVLHSVQPIACEMYPVYILNKRCWCLLTTKHFGPVVQCEIGALIVGGIFNEKENTIFTKGSEKGHFELSGSTIILLFESGQIELTPELQKNLSNNNEVRVIQGEWIGTAKKFHKNLL